MASLFCTYICYQSLFKISELYLLLELRKMYLSTAYCLFTASYKPLECVIIVSHTPKYTVKPFVIVVALRRKKKKEVNEEVNCYITHHCLPPRVQAD